MIGFAFGLLGAAIGMPMLAYNVKCGNAGLAAIGAAAIGFSLGCAACSLMFTFN